MLMGTSVILCEKLHWRAPHMTIYGHKKKVCLEPNISIGSFHASFHNFHYVSIYEMTTKASNGENVTSAICILALHHIIVVFKFSN